MCKKLRVHPSRSRFLERYLSGEQSCICIITGVIIEAFTPDYLAPNDVLDFDSEKHSLGQVEDIRESTTTI